VTLTLGIQILCALIGQSPLITKEIQDAAAAIKAHVAKHGTDNVPLSPEATAAVQALVK